MKKYSTIILFSLFQLIISCQINKNITYRNDDIDSNIRIEIETLNKKVFEDVSQNSTDGIFNMLHSELKNIVNYKSKLSSMVNYLNSNYSDLQPKKYNEFYTLSSGEGERNVSFFSFTKDNFFISLKVWSSELYVSLYESNNFSRDILIALVYEKENNEWRIRNFHIGDRRIFGKTFSQWLIEAKNDKSNKEELPALVKILAVQPLLKPAPFIEYVLDDSTKDFIEEIKNDCFSSDFFPIEFQNIKSKPEIYSIRYQPIINTKEILPIFNYKTNFSLEDESSMQNEVNTMVERLKTIFQGIENQFSGLIFSATKEIPSNYKNVPYYNLIFKFK